MIQRDKNRPSVVMWSIANEPNVRDSGNYFATVAAHARGLDKTRLITAATAGTDSNDKMAVSLDVLMVNRYQGWYQDTGYPQTIEIFLTNNFQNWYDTHKKPIMISEYGADTVPGLHMDPPYVFSEDYQTELLYENFKAFDKLRAKGFFVGEHIWIFADFMTGESTGRVVGNKKGIFTRERQPKASARVLRCRYWKLSGMAKDTNTSPSYCPA